MAKIKDSDVKKWLDSFKRKVVVRYSPEKVILFGSRAREDNLLESDIDLIIVSKKFHNMKWPQRLGKIGELWDGLIQIEPLCYTPEEFEAKSRQIGIVQQAIQEGVILYTPKRKR